MKPQNSPPPNRRDFLKSVALAAGIGSVPASVAGAAAAGASTGASSPPSAYLSLGPDEAAFVETLVNVMCPADDLTPNGVDCGLASYLRK